MKLCLNFNTEKFIVNQGKQLFDMILQILSIHHNNLASVLQYQMNIAVNNE